VRCSADHDRPSKDGWTVEHHLLGDHAAKREPVHVTRLDAETIKESGGMLCHATNSRRHCARGPADASVVEQN